MFEHVINVGIRSNYYSCFVTTIFLFFSSFSLDFLSSFFFFYYSIRNNRIDRMHKATRCVESIRRKGIRVADWNDTRKEKIDRRYLPLTVLKNWDRLRQTVFSPSLFFFPRVFSPVIPPNFPYFANISSDIPPISIVPHPRIDLVIEVRSKAIFKIIFEHLKCDLSSFETKILRFRKLSKVVSFLI